MEVLSEFGRDRVERFQRTAATIEALRLGGASQEIIDSLPD